MVNKLLMMLGTNVHNKREKDARMQRMLQEGQDSSQQEESKADSSRKKKGGRKGADDALLQISHAELKEYWNSLPLAERAASGYVLMTSSRRPCTRSSPRSPAGARTRGAAEQQQQGRQQTRHQQERPPPRRSSRSPNSSFRSSRS